MEIDIKKLKKLIEMLNNTDVAEIELKEGSESIRINRASTNNEDQINSANILKNLALQNNMRMTPNLSSESTSVGDDTVVDVSQSKEKEHNYTEITSPMVGTFYRAATPESKPFVNIGQSVNEGDTLCIIEAMKMFNQIESDKKGVIKEVLIENGQPVEFGQPLFLIAEE